MTVEEDCGEDCCAMTELHKDCDCEDCVACGAG